MLGKGQAIKRWVSLRLVCVLTGDKKGVNEEMRPLEGMVRGMLHVVRDPL